EAWPAVVEATTGSGGCAMPQLTRLQRLAAESEAAAARQIAAARGTPQRRRRQRRSLVVAMLAIVALAAAASWAAISLLSSGAPVPFERGAPVAGRAQGAPIAG